MVQESFDPTTLEQWLLPNLLVWLLTITALTVVIVFCVWLAAVLLHGPVAGTRTSARAVLAGLLDLLLASPRRVAALAWLTIKESIRRRVVLVVVLLFVVILAFAALQLDPSSPDPARLQLGFIFSTTSFLVLGFAWFLSALSLPGDFRNRTIYTVVTKPVRPTEIVLGRILGFTLLGTALLAMMGAISYVFVHRELSHTHTIDPASVEKAQLQWAKALEAHQPLPPVTIRTDEVNNHRHTVVIDPGAAATEGDSKRRVIVHTSRENGHWHDLSYELHPAQDGNKPPEVVGAFGQPQGVFTARIPIYGTMQFKDRSGRNTDKGINVGQEWSYRGYIQGATLAAAVWTFHDLRKENFPNGLPVEMTLAAYRSEKGQMDRGLLASLAVRNPKTGREVNVAIFEVKEYMPDSHLIPTTLESTDGQQVDLFRDLVADGQLEIWIRCVDARQFLGMAQPDLYLHAREGSPPWNFVKANLGIWLQMVLVTSLGVMFSTFLSGPIAWLATLGALVGAMFSDFLHQLSQHPQYGGGFIESGIRLVTQQNMVTPLPESPQTTVAQWLDKAFEKVLAVLWLLLPDFGRLQLSDYVVSGFDVPGTLLAKNSLITAAYVLPAFVLAYFLLKNREVGR